MSDRTARYDIKGKLELLNSETRKKALLLAIEYAQYQRENAAKHGESDMVAAVLEAQVDAYVDGWAQVLPSWLIEFEIQVAYEADTEYDEYKRLHKKFGGVTPREEPKILGAIPHWSDNKKDKKSMNKDLLADFR